MHPFRWGRCRTFVVALGLMGAACTNDTLTPGISVPGRDGGSLLEIEAPIALVTTAVEPTWTDNWLVPDSAWVLVEVEGLIEYSRSDACFVREHKGLCDGPAAPPETEGPYGPLQERGEVRVTFTRPGAQAPKDNFTSGNALFSPTDNPKGEVGRYLMRNVFGPQYVWTRHFIHQVTANNTANPLIKPFPVYVVGPKQRVTISIVPTPLRITGPVEVKKGDSATFTAEVVGDFRIRDPQNRRNQVYWEYFPGDTLERHDPFARRFSIDECDSVVCEYKPEESGRLVANSYIEGQPLSVASAVIRVDSAELKLECNGNQERVRVQRADAVRCEVSGSDEIVGWEFVADSNSYRNPAPDATPFMQTVWQGPMVLSGTVTVRARIAGREESKSVKVDIDPRDWSGMQMNRQVAEEPNSHLPLNPDSVRQLGDIHQRMNLIVSRDRWQPIFSGPNANLAYFVSLPNEYEAAIHVNRAALSPGSNFWNGQRTSQGNSGVVECLQRPEDISGFIPVILRHEGIGYDPKSHAYLYLAKAQEVGNARFEQVVGTDVRNLADQAEPIANEVDSLAAIASAQADSTGFRPPWCRFNYNYRRR